MNLFSHFVGWCKMKKSKVTNSLQKFDQVFNKLVFPLVGYFEKISFDKSPNLKALFLVMPTRSKNKVLLEAESKSFQKIPELIVVVVDIHKIMIFQFQLRLSNSKYHSQPVFCLDCLNWFMVVVTLLKSYKKKISV